jgi:putative copper export protein/mono/diheme cytochrome c family protein
MDWLLIVARALHFAAAISLSGTLAFDCLVGGPALRRADVEAAGLGRRLRALAWASLALALVSGAGWLTATAATMSGRPIAAVWSQGIIATVLTQTRFGEDWLVRLGLAALLAACLAAARLHVLSWPALALAAAMLASLAWAGHGAATPGAPGDFHLAGDLLHLLGAGLWLGTLVPLEMLLAAAGRGGDARWLTAARIATRRFTVLAVASVAALLLGGIVNTWFLAGTVPALVGTVYGRLLLSKIGLFIAMLLVAAVNLLRLTPRLAAAATGPTIAQLRRNVLIETALGLGVLGIVGVLGILPPGLHTEPGWPFPWRIETGALSTAASVALAVLAAVAGIGAILAVAAAAAGRWKRAVGFGGGTVLCLGLAWIPLRPAIEPAYPTSFYAPAQPYAAPSIMVGAKVYADNCTVCHGVAGHGDGPAAASLPVRPANLTEPHVLAHSPGDLFWWVSHGRDGGVMPGFAGILPPGRRWDVINFVRARAAGTMVSQIGPEVTAQAAPQIPDFAFETAGAQLTLRRKLAQGPVLLVLFSPPVPTARLRALAARTGLRVVAVDTAAPAAEPTPPIAQVAPDVAVALALFRPAGDGGAEELLLDRNGAVRARWTAAGGLPDPGALVADAARAAAFAVAAPSHAGHGG